jgi:Dual-action HEIGH metallo-peptidase
MKKIIFSLGTVAFFAIALVGCKKTNTDAQDPNSLSADEKGMIKAAGFNSGWAERTTDGSYLIENDMLLSKAQLEELAGAPSPHNFIVANEEHYRTTNVVSLPSTGQRNITVRLGSGFPSYYSTGLNNALARYNNLNLRIRFTRVSTGGNIVISAASLGGSTSSCTLGQASGFPTNGNPSSGFTLSNSSCATSFLNNASKVDEVMAHEIGHCIGFRHTDYANRASCGGPGEGTSTVGALQIPGTPGTVSGTYNSWMMACTNGDPTITATDAVALNYVY